MTFTSRLRVGPRPQVAPIETADTYTFSEIRQTFGLTARALRYYEEIRLIDAGRDRLNRRTFGPTAYARLQVICPLSRAGVTLQAIGKILSATTSDPAELVAKTLEDQLRALGRQVAIIQDLLVDARTRTPQGKLRGV